MRLGKTLCMALAGGALFLPSTATAATWRHVEGEYAQAAVCVPSGAAPTATVTTWEFSCASGTTTWTGDLRGQTVLSNVRGTIDLLTGATQGTADEVIHLATPDGRSGTLEMTSVFASTGDNGFVATNTILSGSGDFAGAKGTLQFTGQALGAGSYDGWIKTRSVKTRSAKKRRFARR